MAGRELYDTWRDGEIETDLFSFLHLNAVMLLNASHYLIPAEYEPGHKLSQAICFIASA